ncbi:hypothetical protein, conserved [Eimeria tenella]|uniref:Uncharacterized protein n=1 Tax=Eimeria tenella TaxID=5802 RepID=U6KWQ2_EIMTE|nr:hypothetical protein, conserved [Eimeria tenella]CDJ40789.1 hypothetical protein, conserved [Eimeria tenella]|eukprot:XP_013231539.1 hypothetical protein, conserved [Eimeria tenella]
MESRNTSSITGVCDLEEVDEAERQLNHQANRLRVYRTRRAAAIGGLILQQLLRRLAAKQQQAAITRLRSGGPAEGQLLNLAIQMLPK